MQEIEKIITETYTSYHDLFDRVSIFNKLKTKPEFYGIEQNDPNKIYSPGDDIIRIPAGSYEFLYGNPTINIPSAIWCINLPTREVYYFKDYGLTWGLSLSDITKTMDRFKEILKSTPTTIKFDWLFENSDSTPESSIHVHYKDLIKESVKEDIEKYCFIPNKTHGGVE